MPLTFKTKTVKTKGPDGQQKTIDVLRGQSGADGIQGIPGPQGIQGPKGQKGDKGDIGPQGQQGVRGQQGPQGEQGIRGQKGQQGEKGQKGDTGQQGPQGLTGPQGQQGPQGIQGQTGPQGPKGDKGDTGAQGEQGIQGLKGDPGQKGEQGPKGQKGDVGPQGPPGSDATVTAANITSALGYTPADNTTLTTLSDNAVLKNVTEKQTLSSQLFVGSPTANVGNAFTHVRKLSDTPDPQGRTVYGLSFAVGYTPGDWAFASIQFKSYDNKGSDAINEAVLRFARDRLQFGNRITLADRVPAESDYRDIFYDTYQTDKLNTTAKDLIGAINEVNNKTDEQSVKNIINKQYIMSLLDDGSEVEY